MCQKDKGQGARDDNGQGTRERDETGGGEGGGKGVLRHLLVAKIGH